MKYFVILTLLALVAVTFAQSPDQLPSEKKDDAKDLDTANSYGDGYVYPYAYGGYGGGYGSYGGYGGYYPSYYYSYPSYGGYGLYY